MFLRGILVTTAIFLSGYAGAEMAPAAGSRPVQSQADSPSISKTFAGCSSEQKQALATQGCIEHFEKHPDALKYARPCNQSTLEYTYTRALTILPKCSLGVGKAWVDHGSDMLEFLKSTGNAVIKQYNSDKELQAGLKSCNDPNNELQMKKQLLGQYDLKDWEDDKIRKTSCEDIMSAGTKKSRRLNRDRAIRSAAEFDAKPYDEKKAALDAASKQSAEKGREEWNKIYNAAQVWMKEKVGIPLSCYNSQKQDELLCYGVARFITPDAVLGTAAASKMASIAGMTKLTGAEARAAMLARNSSLTTAERVAEAEKALGRSLTSDQKSALAKAHDVGAAEGRGYGTYSRADLDEKARTLKEAGFTTEERRTLMNRGIAGNESYSGSVSGASTVSGDTAKYIKNVPEGIEDRAGFAKYLQKIEQAEDGDKYKDAFRTWKQADKDLDKEYLRLIDTRTPTGAAQAKEIRRYQQELKELYEHYEHY